MTDDIVTRLRALASRCSEWSLEGETSSALREAAESLDSLLTDQEMTGVALGSLEIERDALKAKLAMGMQSIDSAWKVSYEKAEAEAAALREALTFYADYASWTASKVDYAGVGTPGPAYSDTGRKARKAISQPGPGAAYQERLRETESKFATQSHNLNVMNERLKKLEAVAVAVKANAALFSDDEPLTFENCEPIRLALVALEEKP